MVPMLSMTLPRHADAGIGDADLLLILSTTSSIAGASAALPSTAGLSSGRVRARKRSVSMASEEFGDQLAQEDLSCCTASAPSGAEAAALR